MWDILELREEMPEKYIRFDQFDKHPQQVTNHSSGLKKVLFVLGTRPEAIKMAPVIKEFKNYKAVFETRVCVTAQHRKMLDQVLKIFRIVPDYDLDLMKEKQDLYDITGRVLLGMRTILMEWKPSLVLVHGDTTSSTAAALSAFYQQIPVGHVEAGLRTNNIYSPWPEEVNRQITGRIATYHFAPTEMSRENLIKENVNPENITVTGNTVIDALLDVVNSIKENLSIQKSIIEEIEMFGYPIQKRLLEDDEKQLILITGHRRENFGEGFINICKGLKQIAGKYTNIDIVYPVHLNPNVQTPVYTLLSDSANIFLIDPIDYLPFVFLMYKSTFIITDSGGVQEEAPSLGKPVLVMRDTTERPEAVTAGTAKLVGKNYKRIYSEASNLINNQTFYDSMSKAHNPYGDGKASKKIRKYIQHKYK
jgi:UDP-N-acetylglucosamine 2-epimerase (non-hydrolysing)